MNVFFELHKEIPREGPGTDMATKCALDFVTALPVHPKVIDIGCGPGMQTLELARHLKTEIIGLDAHKPFLDQLEKSAANTHLVGKIRPVLGDMFHLEYPDETFDLIWSEGAIYIIGFDKGINDWRALLKSGGYLVVSEISWLRQGVPEQLRAFWEAEYPSMASISENIKRVESAGYEPVANFVLPKEGWWQHYYTPLLRRADLLREKYASDEDALKVLDATFKEAEMFERYSDYYGYVFYIMRKI